MFDEHSGRSPSRESDNDLRRDLPSTSTDSCKTAEALNGLFRPFSLSLIALALLIALWGFGYKISLYHRHTDPLLQSNVAKLWIEQRNNSTAVASISNAKPPSTLLIQALSNIVQLCARSRHAVACSDYIIRDIDNFGTLIPFRSPPRSLA